MSVFRVGEDARLGHALLLLLVQDALKILGFGIKVRGQNFFKRVLHVVKEQLGLQHEEGEIVLGALRGAPAGQVVLLKVGVTVVHGRDDGEQEAEELRQINVIQQDALCLKVFARVFRLFKCQCPLHLQPQPLVCVYDCVRLVRGDAAVIRICCCVVFKHSQQLYHPWRALKDI